MNAFSVRTRIGSAAGGAGEWMYYPAGVWIAFNVGGLPIVALYVASLTLPATLIRSPNRAGSFLTPLALGLMAFTFDNISPAMIAALGLTAGAGSALSGRPVAWTAGLSGSLGLGGVLGAVGAVVLTAALGGREVLVAGAGLLLIAWILGERHRLAGPPARLAVPALVGVAFAFGIRIVEPALPPGGELSTALLAAGWAIGSHVGWRVDANASARVVLAMPFVMAAVLAVVGVVDGPVLPFLYGAVAASVALMSSSSAPVGTHLWEGNRAGLAVAALAGAAFASSTGAIDLVAFGSSAAVIAGGFVAYGLARRVEPSKATAQRVAEIDEELIGRAIAELLGAMTRARQIRSDAIAAFRQAVQPDPVQEAKQAAARVVDQLVAKVRVVGDNLDALLAQDGNLGNTN